MKTCYAKTTLSIGLMFMLVASATAQRPVPILDTTPPVATLHVNDGLNAGPIIHTAPFLINGVPVPYPTLPSALGCDSVDTGNDMPNWDALHPLTDFTDPWVLNRTYYYEGSTPSFTLRAEDSSGIKKVEVSVVERDVITAYGGFTVIDAGPTEFMDVSPTRAVRLFAPIWYQSTASGAWYFSHYEKQLKLEPRSTRIVVPSVLNFSMSAFGATAQLRVRIEDNAGNLTYGSVFLAPLGMCL